jgi:segregation and condensation protein B
LETVKQHIEALIFASPQAISLSEIKHVLEEKFGTRFLDDFLLDLLNSIVEKYQDNQFSFEIKQENNGYVFLTKPMFKETLTLFLKQAEKKKLTNATLEVLAIIAYRQPVTRHDIEEIRGVNCDYLINKLLEKELISINGRSNSPGRPLLYETSHRFLNHFGLKNISELPKLKEIAPPKESIGTPDPAMEN